MMKYVTLYLYLLSYQLSTLFHVYSVQCTPYLLISMYSEVITASNCSLLLTDVKCVTENMRVVMKVKRSREGKWREVMKAESKRR